MKKQRNQYAPEEEVAILRRHLLEKEPISKLCDEVGLQPTVFYRWQKEFSENGAAAFEQKRPTTIPLTRSGLHTCRKRSRRRTRFWPSSWRSTSR
jgi:transposase-like protein